MSDVGSGPAGGPAPPEPPKESQRAVFVDRDGTINPDLKYLADPARLEVFLGVGDGLRTLHDAGFLLVCVTNQSGVERKFYSHEDVARLHLRVNEILRPRGVQIDAFYYCPHAPETGCSCRKPKTGMYERAAREWNIRFPGSAMVGDRSLDVQAGAALGLATILVPSPGHEEAVTAELASSGVRPDFIAASFREAARLILSRE